MQEYDAALKLLLQASAGSLVWQLSGGLQATRWLQTEFTQVQAQRADLLGIIAENDLIHIEPRGIRFGDLPPVPEIPEADHPLRREPKLRMSADLGAHNSRERPLGLLSEIYAQRQL